MTIEARRQLVALLACTALLASACSDDGGSASTTTAAAEATTTTILAVPGPCGSTDAQLVALVRAASDAAHEAQLEMVLSAPATAEDPPDELDRPVAADLLAQRDRTDAAAEALLASVEGAGIDEEALHRADLLAAIASAEDRIDGLDTSRKAVDDIQVTMAITRGSFAQLARSFAVVVDESRRCARSGGLAHDVFDLQLLQGRASVDAELSALLTTVTTVHQLSDEAREDLEQLAAERDAAQAVAMDLGSAAMKQLMRSSTESDAAVAEAIDQVAATPRDAAVSFEPDRWRGLAEERLDELRAIEVELLDALGDAGSEGCGTNDADLVVLAAAAGEASHQAELEVLLAAASMASEHTDPVVRAALDAQRPLTDEAAAGFVAAAGDVPIDEASEGAADLAAAISSVEERVEGHGTARTSIDEGQVAVGEAREAGAQHAWTYLGVIDGARACAASGELAADLLDLELITAYEGTLAELDALVAVVATSGTVGSADRDELISLLAERNAGQRRIYGLASAEMRALVRSSNRSDSELNSVVEQVLGTPEGAPAPITGEEWVELAEAHLAELHAVEVQLVDQLTDIKL